MSWVSAERKTHPLSCCPPTIKINRFLRVERSPTAPPTWWPITCRWEDVTWLGFLPVKQGSCQFKDKPQSLVEGQRLIIKHGRLSSDRQGRIGSKLLTSFLGGPLDMVRLCAQVEPAAGCGGSWEGADRPAHCKEPKHHIRTGSAISRMVWGEVSGSPTVVA